MPKLHEKGIKEPLYPEGSSRRLQPAINGGNTKNALNRLEACSTNLRLPTMDLEGIIPFQSQQFQIVGATLAVALKRIGARAVAYG